MPQARKQICPGGGAMFCHVVAGDTVGDTLKAEGRHQPIENGRSVAMRDRLNQSSFSGLGIDFVKKGHRTCDGANGVNQANRAIQRSG